jgi:hypothetical protein
MDSAALERIIRRPLQTVITVDVPRIVSHITKQGNDSATSTQVRTQLRVLP